MVLCLIFVFGVNRHAGLQTPALFCCRVHVCGNAFDALYGCVESRYTLAAVRAVFSSLFSFREA